MAQFVTDHIAPCGINCATCLAFLREKNKCVGCKTEIGCKANHCRICKIKNCDFLASTNSKLCFECAGFPCKRIKQIDKRYRTEYNTSLIGNLENIRLSGMTAFLNNEGSKWHCNQCGGTICVHRGICLNCSIEKKKTKKTEVC